MMKANPEEIKESVAVHEEVPKEEAAVKTWSTEEVAWGPASSSKVPQSAKGMDPGQWWIPEVGHCPKTVDIPCQSCVA
jgi:hypothetical protein